MANIRQIRKRLGLSQVEFGNAIGASQASVSHYERGKQEVMPGIAVRVIEAAKLRGHELTFDDIYAPSCGATTTKKTRK